METKESNEINCDCSENTPSTPSDAEFVNRQKSTMFPYGNSIIKAMKERERLAAKYKRPADISPEKDKADEKECSSAAETDEKEI